MIKVNPPYLEANDPETRSTLPYKEKEDLVIEAIAKLYNPSKGPNLQLKRTRKNGLSVCSRNEVLQVLDWLAKDKHIKTCPEDYPYKTIESSGFGDSYNEPVEIDPKKPFSIEVFPSFSTWYETNQVKKNMQLSTLAPDIKESVENILSEIEKKYKVKPGHEVTLDVTNRVEGTALYDALEFLKGKEDLSYELIDTKNNKQQIKVFLSDSLITLLKKKSTVLYEITFNDMKGEVFLNGTISIANPDFETENELVMQYLIDNPNKTITKEMIEEELLKKKIDLVIKKPFHKIVENLGFSQDLRKIFFKISKNSIYFRNPVTEYNFEKLGIPRLEIKSK